MCPTTESDNEVNRDIEEIIAKICQKEGFLNYTTKVSKGAEKGDNFFGQVFAVNVSNQENSKKLNLFIKFSPSNEKVRAMAPIRKNYENEILFYTEIYPAMVKLQKEKAVENPISTIPKCLLTSLTDKKEYIVMENLKEEGFELIPKDAMFTDEQNQKIFEEYGRIHALSFALKKNDPEKFKKITYGLHNMMKEFFHGPLLTEDSVKKIYKQAQESLVNDKSYHEKFQYYVDNGMEILKASTDIWDEPYSTISHGDGWSNNLLFKYEDTKDGKILQNIKILDWQLLSLSSPISDLAFALYAGNDGENLDKRDRYLQVYHNSLSRFLKELGCDVEELYPYQIMLEHWKKYAKIKLLWSVNFHMIKLTKSNKAKDLTDYAEDQTFGEDILHDEKVYNRRIRDLLIHGFDQNVL